LPLGSVTFWTIQKLEFAFIFQTPRRFLAHSRSRSRKMLWDGEPVWHRDAAIISAPNFVRNCTGLAAFQKILIAFRARAKRDVAFANSTGSSAILAAIRFAFSRWCGPDHRIRYRDGSGPLARLGGARISQVGQPRNSAIHRPQSSSASHFTAGAAGFLIFSQCGERGDQP